MTIERRVRKVEAGMKNLNRSLLERLWDRFLAAHPGVAKEIHLWLLTMEHDPAPEEWQDVLRATYVKHGVTEKRLREFGLR